MGDANGKCSKNNGKEYATPLSRHIGFIENTIGMTCESYGINGHDYKRCWK
ncbi:MAG: hypothetical protein OCC49_13695 [Fibrobacterales bacterium]